MDDLGDLAELCLLAVLATYRSDGTVLLSPVWHEWRDGGFQVGGLACVLACTPGRAACCHLRLLPAADRQPEWGEGRGRCRQPQVTATVRANVLAWAA